MADFMSLRDLEDGVSSDELTKRSLQHNEGELKTCQGKPIITVDPFQGVGLIKPNMNYVSQVLNSAYLQFYDLSAIGY